MGFTYQKKDQTPLIQNVSEAVVKKATNNLTVSKWTKQKTCQRVKKPKTADHAKEGSLSSDERKRGGAVEVSMNKRRDGGKVKAEPSKFMGSGIA